jgi:hypothetical protein
MIQCLVIDQLHFVCLEVNQSMFGSHRHLEQHKTITTLEFDQYEVLWSRVQQY